MSEIKNIQNPILRLLKDNGIHGHKTQWIPRGWPDLEIFLPEGRVILCECKRVGEDLSPLQKVWKRELEALGFEFITATSKEQFAEELWKRYKICLKTKQKKRS